MLLLIFGMQISNDMQEINIGLFLFYFFSNATKTYVMKLQANTLWH